MNKKSKKRQKNANPNNNEANYNVGDLVGAKIKGHPLWPGEIEKVDFANNKRKYTIRFFGTNDTSQTFVNNLIPFKDFTPKDKACNRRGFQDALLLCQTKYDSLGCTKEEQDGEDGEEEEQRKEEEEVELSNEVKVNEEQDDQEKEDQAGKEKEQQNQLQQQQPEQQQKDQTAAVESTSSPQSSTKVSSLSVQESMTPSDREIEGGDSTLNDNNNSTKNNGAVNRIFIRHQAKSPTNNEVHPSIEPRLAGKRKRTFTKSLKRLHQGEQTMQQNKSPKSEGENVMITSDLQSTIAKLKEKVAKKIEEKEARKSKLKEKKLSSKVSTKLVVINKNLGKFSTVLKRLSGGQFNITEWSLAVRIYNSVLPVLARCIEYSMANERSNANDCRKCHDYLESIVENLKLAKKLEQVPNDIKKELKECLKLMKSHKLIKDFLNSDKPENLKNAMVERKENATKKRKVR